MRLEIVLKYIGLSLLVVALFMLISAGVSFINGKDAAFIPLLYSGFITVILAGFPYIFVRSKGALSSKEGYFIVVGAWLMSCIVGMIPFLMYGGDFKFTNALFESISGFTTTGASILNDIEALPKGLLFWRISTAWIGGIGVVTIFSLMVSSASGNSSKLTGAEVSDLVLENKNVMSSSMVKIMIATYLAMTLSAFILLWISGMSCFDALTHAMSACSTCGFSTRNASIGAYDSPLIESILILFMLMASIRFLLLYGMFFKKDWKGPFKSEITKAFLWTVLVGITGVTLSLYFNGTGSILYCLRQGSFQIASIFSTTGFATTDTNVWPFLCKSILLTGSLFCGCSGSTSGGMKTDRLVTGAKALNHRIALLRSPHSVKCIKVEGKIKSDEEVENVMIFIGTYLFFIFIGGLSFAACGIDLKTSWSAAIACMGNVGPGFGEVGSMSNYAGLPGFAKYVGMALMLIGRLEIFPVLYVFGLITPRLHHRHHV